MKFRVGWKGLGGVEVEVDAGDRWDAVVKAAAKLGIDSKMPMQALFDAARVGKVEKKRERIWRAES